MRRAEAEAVSRGCHAALVDTMDWQARPFYEKHGYQVLGKLDDVPVGHTRFFMKTRLGDGPARPANLAPLGAS